MELYALKQFVTFADAGTLSEAAEILHLSQPALSRNMKKLENDLGIPLFERKKKKISCLPDWRIIPIRSLPPIQNRRTNNSIIKNAEVKL